MKTLLTISAFVLCMLFFSANTFAQDFVTVNPKGKKVLADTTFVRAIEVEFAPGQIDPMHWHPAHFYYALTDGKLKVTFADGTVQTYELKAGDSGVSGPEAPHSTENVSDHPIKFLLVELKDRPYKEAKKK